MQIAILSDIHGNSVALDAVLADIDAQGGADAYWVLGDLVALGHDPITVLDRLSALPNARFARGNTDRYVCTGDRPGPSLEDTTADLGLLPILVEVAGTFAWTQGAVTVAGWLDWLADLSTELRADLPDGTRWLGVHASPGCDDGPGIRPDLSQEELQALVAGCDADLICVGHTHWPLEVVVAGKRVVNLGSVSNPWAPDLRASYALLQAEQSGYTIERRRVDYDRASVVAALQRMRHPGADYVTKHLLGQAIAPWQR